MGTVGARAAEFAIVVAVMAIGAEDNVPLPTSRAEGGRIQIQHVHQKAGLRQGASSAWVTGWLEVAV